MGVIHVEGTRSDLFGSPGSLPALVGCVFRAAFPSVWPNWLQLVLPAIGAPPWVLNLFHTSYLDAAAIDGDDSILMVFISGVMRVTLGARGCSLPPSTLSSGIFVPPSIVKAWA